jgi:protocatechuate 3,4-dioxygenase beta subunit
VLTPEQTQGPYYVSGSLMRSDITEGQRGLPLDLRLVVQRVGSCEAIRDATVEVWHANASGTYSGFTAQGAGGAGPPGGSRQVTDATRFLRGAQRSDADGAVTFRTIYPGWYQGRTTHIHVKVHLGGSVVHTGQLYFDQAVSDAVYRTPPYASHGEPTTTNSTDGIYADGGRESTLTLRRSGSGYAGRLVLGVKA